MDAGRELDALIALRVLDWSEQNLRHAQMANGDYFDYDGDTGLPRYSTDIAAAWQVVDQMSRSNWHLHLAQHIGEWEAIFMRPINDPRFNRDQPGGVMADAAAVAICLAALKAVNTKTT
jgi:hypothetical protein